MTLTVQNVQVYRLDRGSGTPILFLHGNPDSADLWDPVTVSLSQQYRCLAPDLPGFARSSAPHDFDCSLSHMARFIDGLFQALGIVEPLNLVVHDFGGPYGLAWAVQNPARLNRLVLTNTFFSPTTAGIFGGASGELHSCPN